MRRPESYQSKSEVLRDIDMLDRRLLRMTRDYLWHELCLDDPTLYLLPKEIEAMNSTFKLLGKRINETATEIAELQEILKRFPDVRLIASIGGYDKL